MSEILMQKKKIIFKYKKENLRDHYNLRVRNNVMVYGTKLTHGSRIEREGIIKATP
ncbi:hypothetical protein HanXRQr2_Chr16g0768801 [Helianthus annuus]|uniref:Uncharacterized protein n=1 Tax=Helianthus annuus TaxID=4232 RepID=A0A9K3H0A0_HELAN|nr:hypothetical protein HanXRQr2_Chr16g0768801 [Helianthus annuus]